MLAHALGTILLKPNLCSQVLARNVMGCSIKGKKKELFLPFTKFISLHKTAPWELRNDESLWWLWLAESMGYLSSLKVCGIGVGCAGQGFLETSVCLSIASYRDTHPGAMSRM